MVARRPHANGETSSLQLVWHLIGKARLEVDEVPDRVQTRVIHGICGALAFVKNADKHLDEGASQTRSTRRADRNR